MTYTPNTWQDRIVVGGNKFLDQYNNELILTPNPDSVTQQGTPFTAEWMNHIEQGIADVAPVIETINDWTCRTTENIFECWRYVTFISTGASIADGSIYRYNSAQEVTLTFPITFSQIPVVLTGAQMAGTVWASTRLVTPTSLYSGVDIFSTTQLPAGTQYRFGIYAMGVIN